LQNFYPESLDLAIVFLMAY